MERALLEDCLTKEMSLDAIGDLVGRHPSTVSYWLKKYGLSPANADVNRSKGAIDQKSLEELVANGLTLREMAKQLSRGISTVRYWMARYEIDSPRRWRERPPGDPKRAIMACRRHGATEFVLEGRGFYRCARCRVEAVAKRHRVVKQTLVEEAGGQCVVCGYARCQRALQFHHLDPATKKFHLGHAGHSRSLARSRGEAKKCILLCANCHAEVEAGLVEMPLHSTAEVDSR